MPGDPRGQMIAGDTAVNGRIRYTVAAQAIGAMYPTGVLSRGE